MDCNISSYVWFAMPSIYTLSTSFLLSSPPLFSFVPFFLGSYIRRGFSVLLICCVWLVTRQPDSKGCTTPEFL